MFDKNDPLIDAVKKVMQINAAEREAEKSVNEKFGIQDRNALPHEYMGEWNAEYKSVLSEGIEALDEAALPKPPETVKAVKALGPAERERRAALHAAESARHEGVYAKYDSQGKQGTRAAQKALENSTHHSEMAERYRDPKSHFENLKNRERDFADGGIHVYKEEALDEADKDKFAGAQKMPYIIKKGVKKLPLTPMPNATKPPKDKFANGVKLEEGEEGTVPKTPKERILAKKFGSKKHITHGDVLKGRGIFEDETPMTKMGITKPDYAPAGTTPDYAKTKEQTPNSAAKTSLPAGTLKKSIKENSLTSIQEEISYNLAEEAFNIYESNGQDEFLQYIDSLNEEQIDLLVVNEEFMQFVINEGLWDSISAGARGAWDSATLGGGKYVVGGVKHLYNKATGKKSSYSDEVDKEVAASEKAQKDHPTAYTVGNYGADAAMLATGGGAIARFAAKQALKAGVKSAAKTAASKKSGIAKATDSVSGIGLGVGTAGHAGAGLSGQHKGLYEDVTIFTEQLSDYLYENYTLEELYALTEEQVDQIVDENWKTDALEYGGKLVSKIPGVDNLVKKTSDWMSRGTTKAAGTTTKATNTTVDAGQLAADNAKKAKADAIAKNTANKKVVAGAKPVEPPVSPSAGKKGAQAPPKPKKVTKIKPSDTKTTKETPMAGKEPQLLTKGQKVLEIAKNNKAKLAAIAAGTAAVATAGLSGDSTTKTASATGEDGAFDRNKTPTTSDSNSPDSSKVPPKPKLKPAKPGKAAPKAAAPVKPEKKSKMKLQRKSKIRTLTRQQEADRVAGPNQKPYKHGRATY